MSVALQVMLLVVVIVLAVAGIGVALALRVPKRQPTRHASHKEATAHAAKHRAGSAPVIPLAAVRARAAAADAPAKSAPVEALDPEQARLAKVAALQAMLALGDAQAERVAKSGKAQFADTEAADEGYAATQFAERDSPTTQISLLNLDKVPSKRKRAQQ